MSVWFKRKSVEEEEPSKPEALSCYLSILEGQVRSLHAIQRDIEELECKIHNIQTKFYPMIAYFICAFADAVDSSPLRHARSFNSTGLDRGTIEQIMEMLCAYLESEELRNRVEGVDTFDVEQFLTEFKELCDYKSREALYCEQLADLRERESKIKKFLGIK